MKTLNYYLIGRKLLLVLMALVVLAACKKDDNNDNNDPPTPVNPLVGTYEFVAATFDQAITVIVNGDTNHYAVGDNAFLFVGGGLLGAAPCDDEANARLQLRENYTAYYICVGETNESQQGTWAYSEEKNVLTLYIANPADFVVPITNIVVTDTELSGNIPALPMPIDTSIPVGDPLPGGGINFQVAKVSVEFMKTN
jgi:hypothetical protein